MFFFFPLKLELNSQQPHPSRFATAVSHGHCKLHALGFQESHKALTIVPCGNVLSASCKISREPIFIH